MCDKRAEDMDADELLEALVRCQRAKIEKILNEQKGSFKEKFEPEKKKAEDAFGSIVALLTDPAVQRHFMKAGIEFFAGLDELIRNIPVPENIKDAVNKARKAREEASEDAGAEEEEKEKAPPRKKPAKSKKMKKIDVE